MQQKMLDLDEILLAGMKIRTNNQAEMSAETANIGNLVERYYSTVLGNIPDVVDPNTTYTVYTAYDSDLHGEYTCFIGQAVHTTKNMPDNLFTLNIPQQRYCQLTTEPGPLPDIVIQAWESIWQMKANDFGAERAYIADFEKYDHRNIDPENAVINIYVGVKANYK